MKREKIRANVLTSWPVSRRTKFRPGDIVQIEGAHKTESNLLKKRAKCKEIGRVFAVSCTDAVGTDGNKLIRTWNYLDGHRGYTRYYVQFADGECFGIQSQYLSKVLDAEI